MAACGPGRGRGRCAGPSAAMIGLGGGVGGCKAVERWHPLHDAKRIDFKSCELHWQPQPLAPGPPTFPRPTGRAGNVSPNPAALSRAAPCGTLDLLPARARRVVLEDNDRGKNLKESGSRGKDASAKRKDLKSQTARLQITTSWPLPSIV